MNATKDGIKDRQVHTEDYLQMVSTESKEYAEVSAHQRITVNNDIITDVQTDKLMERILQKDNLNKAYKKVKSNKGAGGVDGMNVDELLSFLKDNQKPLVQRLREGKYKDLEQMESTLRLPGPLCIQTKVNRCSILSRQI